MVGGSNQSGNMFDLIARVENIKIHSFDLNLPTTFTHHIQVYTKAGAYAGFEHDANSWTLEADLVVSGHGTGNRSPLGLNIFAAPIEISMGSSQAFYVTTTNIEQSLVYSIGTSAGSIFVENDHLQFSEGVGVVYPFSTNFGPRIFNGVISYSLDVSPSAFPTSMPSVAPSHNPSTWPSPSPADNPSIKPNFRPSYFPSIQPSSVPSAVPSLLPSIAPSEFPSIIPSADPSTPPTQVPSMLPTVYPSIASSMRPSLRPTTKPTIAPLWPTPSPSARPTTNKPSAFPSTIYPSSNPSFSPSLDPSALPSSEPSSLPTNIPSFFPMVYPSSKPSLVPSKYPTIFPTTEPINNPSDLPTWITSKSPTLFPTIDPTYYPSDLPTWISSKSPTLFPIIDPTHHPSDLSTWIPSEKPTTDRSNASYDPSIVPTFPPNTSFPTPEPSEMPFPKVVMMKTMRPSVAQSIVPSQMFSHAPSNIPTDQLKSVITSELVLHGTTVDDPNGHLNSTEIEVLEQDLEQFFRDHNDDPNVVVINVTVISQSAIGNFRAGLNGQARMTSYPVEVMFQVFCFASGDVDLDRMLLGLLDKYMGSLIGFIKKNIDFIDEVISFEMVESDHPSSAPSEVPTDGSTVDVSDGVAANTLAGVAAASVAAAAAAVCFLLCIILPSSVSS